MLHVRVFCDGEYIGTCDLYSEDPPMGVASGEITSSRSAEGLTNKLLSGAPDFGKAAQVQAVDGASVLGPDSAATIEVGPMPGDPLRLTVIGIAYPEYEVWFGSDPAFVAYWTKATAVPTDE